MSNEVLQPVASTTLNFGSVGVARVLQPSE
jgi:hypothetical protein